MFLEFCGKLCFSQIRPTVFYFFLLIPFFFSGTYLLNRYGSEQELEHRFIHATKKGKVAMERKMRKDRFIKRYSKADPFFLDKYIESLSFLQKERSIIQSMVDHPAVPTKEPFQERLEFLEGKKNRLAFTEENIRSSPRVKEMDEKQRHPIQINESDLQQLLTWIEDVPVGTCLPVAPHRPQLLIQDMKLRKIKNQINSELYEVDMKLLKREWIE
jgi:hypothetical protein